MRAALSASDAWMDSSKCGWGFAVVVFLMAFASTKTHAGESRTIYQNALGSIVTVYEDSKDASGTGFGIEDGSLVLTAYHVVQGAKEVDIEPSGGPAEGKRIRARVIGGDPELDIAVLKIDGSVRLKPLRLSESKSLAVGDAVYTIGSPRLLKGTLTEGKVTGAIRRNELYPNQHYLQTSLALEPGNSGGPALNENGDVVGIVVGDAGNFGGMGMAITSEEIADALPVLKTKGAIARGYTGLNCKALEGGTELDAEMGDLGIPKGFAPCFLMGVGIGSPAEQAGLRKYDLITQMNGKYLDPKRFYSELLAFPIGQEVSFTAIVEHKKREVKVKVSERPKDPPKLNEDPRTNEAVSDVPKTPSLSPQKAPFGIVVVKTYDHACEQVKLRKGCAGVAINQIAEGSPADDKELFGGVITAVDGAPVTSPETYYAAVARKKSIKLTVTLPDVGTKTITIP
jgi:S1-C subfamily serine protease